ncbi:MAG: protein kinase, partial [Verrucomicrobiota bacterium]
MLRRIGGGAYGEVYLVRSVTGRYRALKIVRREDFELDRTFEREFQGIERYETVSKDHHSLVDILHVGREGDEFYYYVMELADGIDGTTSDQLSDPDSYEPRTLSHDIAKHGPRSIDDCILLGRSLSDGLAHLHAAGLTHRDVKPSNIIYVEGQPKLADIGLVAATG